MSDINKAYRLAWYKLKEEIKTTKTSFGRNELLTVMTNCLEESLEEISNE